jgi:hypothetical protein
MTSIPIGGGGIQIPQEKQPISKTLNTELKNKIETELIKEPAQEAKNEITKDPKISEKLKELVKAGPTLEKMKFFDHDLQDAKATLSDMMAGSGNPTANHFKLDALIEKMDKKELLAFAKHIGKLMENTDGKDDMLGKILNRVLNEVDQQDNPTKPDDNIFIAKYNCSYSTKTLVI